MRFDSRCCSLEGDILLSQLWCGARLLRFRASSQAAEEEAAAAWPLLCSHQGALINWKRDI